MPDNATDLASDTSEPDPMTFRFDNSYVRLPSRFFARLDPTPVGEPRLICLNNTLAVQLGLDPEILASPDGVLELAGVRVPRGAEPLAMAYAGHQFGNFVPQLGDGRALLLGEVIDRSGERRDIQLKGAGPTPFSRRGDGRAALGPALREFIVSEAMAGLGIPTTRSLAVVATGETVMREMPHPGAVLTRVAASHIRVGTFQYFAARDDTEGLRLLADHVIARHYPQALQPDGAASCRALLDAVIARTGKLVAAWQSVGFIHGVMNTDNMSVAGETIDYGPCAFMDSFHPGTVYSSIDAAGRYAYGNQPQIAHWNMARLAEAMLPLLGPDREASVAVANEALGRYPELYQSAWDDAFRHKLGLATSQEGDRGLAHDLLTCMAEQKADFTLVFRGLARAASDGPDSEGERALCSLFAEPAALGSWLPAWRERLSAEAVTSGARLDAMQRVNPAFIARNHRVEAALAAAEAGDRQPLEALLEVLRHPFDDQVGQEAYAAPPRPEEVVHATFCGT